MYCTQCGKELPDDANFCLKCGTPQRNGLSRSVVPEDTERELHRYVIDKRTTFVITNKRTIYDTKGFLGYSTEIPLRHIIGASENFGKVLIRRTDGSVFEFIYDQKAKEVAQAIRDVIAGL